MQLRVGDGWFAKAHEPPDVGPGPRIRAEPVDVLPANRQRRYVHTVPGARNTWRVMALVCITPFTVEVNVALLPSLKVNMA